MKIKIGDKEEKPEPRKHTPEMRMSGVICSVCRVLLGSQNQDKPCPGPAKED